MVNLNNRSNRQELKSDHFCTVPVDIRIFHCLARGMINPTDFLLYAYLLRRTKPSDFNSEAYPENDLIKEETGIGRTAVTEGLRNLERCGIITILRSSRKSKMRYIRVNLRAQIPEGGGSVKLSPSLEMPALTRKEFFKEQKAIAMVKKPTLYSAMVAPKGSFDDDEPPL